MSTNLDEFYMFKVIIIAAILLFIAILGMGVRIFFTKKGTFPNTHIGGNKYLSEKGIHCASTQDWEMRTRVNPMDEVLKSDK